MIKGEYAEKAAGDKEQRRNGLVFVMNPCALPLDIWPSFRFYHHDGDCQEQDANVFGQIIVVAADHPGDGNDQEKGKDHRSGAAQSGEANRFDAPSLQHQPLAGQDGQSGLGIGRA
ncbi:MAG: hypothetical protein A4E49_00371 [Methanosaeta sp. PtaU1.Bin112]|nr:MAG: hypothetical protein A4E49_00371 [Methanosaeta sp. PtaU1.Bin112]